jgi:hypothetical protein
VQHDADKVQKTMSPQVNTELGLCFQLHDADHDSDTKQPTIVEKQQASFNTKRMGIYVKQALRH